MRSLLEDAGMRLVVGLMMTAVAGFAHAGDYVFFDSFEIVPHPAPGAVIVTEIMSNPTNVPDTTGEWFELTNVSAQSVDLGGCIVSRAPTQNTLPSLLLAPDASAVLARSTDTLANGNVMAFATFTFTLTMSGTVDFICDGRLIDTMTWPGEIAGRSRSLDPRHFDAVSNDNDANWCFSTTLYNATDAGTPRTANETCP